MSAQRRVPSPSSQLRAEEDSLLEHDLTDALHFTTEEIAANLSDKHRALLLDEMIDTLEAFESLSDVEIDLAADAEANILNQPVWMDAKVYPMDVPSPAQYGQMTITHLANVSYDVLASGAFTPPQTPPYEQHHYQPASVGYEPGAQQAQPELAAYAGGAESESGGVLDIPLGLELAACASQSDVARELAVVDELVRSRANSFECSSSAPASPTTSWASSHSSSTSSCGESSPEDCEWTPAEARDHAKKAAQRGRKRSKPYAPDDQSDRRSRKKEQNKNAATRYRMKKKAEVAEIQSEEHDLERARLGHEEKIVDLEREIKLIKGLMSEFFKKQGLIQ